MTLPKRGDRVRMTGVMPNDPDPIPVGLEGTVTEVNADVRQIYVDWDADETGRKRTLILLTDDPFEVLPQQSTEYVQPPEGWFDFGLHAYEDVPLEFSEAVDDGLMPRWERPVPPAVHPFIEDVDDGSMCLCGVPALTHDVVYPPGKEDA